VATASVEAEETTSSAHVWRSPANVPRRHAHYDNRENWPPRGPGSALTTVHRGCSRTAQVATTSQTSRCSWRRRAETRLHRPVTRPDSPAPSFHVGTAAPVRWDPSALHRLFQVGTAAPVRRDPSPENIELTHSVEPLDGQTTRRDRHLNARLARPRLRYALAAIVAASASVLTPLAAVPAHAAEPTYRFTPIRMTVYDIEDAWPDTKDEPRLYYGGAVWADIVGVGGYSGSIEPVTFTGSTMSFDLWERDNGWTDHNHLGYTLVDTTQLNQERALRFHTSWWNYEFTYKVERVS
jgi:hypothetical protein